MVTYTFSNVIQKGWKPRCPKVSDPENLELPQERAKRNLEKHADISLECLIFYEEYAELFHWGEAGGGNENSRRRTDKLVINTPVTHLVTPTS